jgi:acetaldehyde dehydrogenase/alcohol dehydrogenase
MNHLDTFLTENPEPENRVTTKEELDVLISRVKAAQKKFAGYSQKQVDHIFRSAALAAANARIPLAELAVEETGMGVVEDKVIKNHFASEYIYNKYKDEKTCGILSQDDEAGTITIAEPVGLICGIIPTTNPTSTAIFKTLISLKTRNGIIISPHPRARRSTCVAARLVLRAAVAAGAPEDIIGCIDEPTVELSNQLMRHAAVKLILATGGPGMVHAAYSSGTPAIGVGAGNTPVVIDETADQTRAIASILMSKTFDNGVICASEQAVIAVDSIYDSVRDRFSRHGGFILDKEQTEAVRRVLFVDGAVNAKIVGQAAPRIAEMAGIIVPATTKVLIGEVTDATVAEPFAHEKLCTVLALYRAKDFKDAVEIASKLVALGGIGHTSVLFTNQDQQKERIEYFGERMKTARILINTPSSHGGIGDLYNFSLAPSLTLGCGSWGGNSVSENVGPMHLLNKKIVAKRAENALWHKLPGAVYFRRGCIPEALKDIAGKQRALIVTDDFLFRSGSADDLIATLKEMGMEVDIFSQVQADPNLTTVRQCVEVANRFKPDVIVAFGGGSPMDAAKIAWVMYEHPEVDFEDLAMRFMDIRKRIYKFPRLGTKAKLVAIPTTSGTGSEVTPFAVVTDDVTGKKYPIADYELTPDLAIVDPNLVMNLPKPLTAYGGIDAVVHALEAYVSIMANEFTDGQALQALKLLKDNLPSAYKNGARDPHAREKVHYASTIAGIAFANAFLGACHSMAHKVGAAFHLPHGLANALLIGNVIRYNANDNPTKQAAFSQYDRPKAKCRYAEIADHLALGGDTKDEKVANLIAWVETLKWELEIPASMQAAGIDEKKFMEQLDNVAHDAFDDQCTGANPRYPLIEEFRAILLDSYYGWSFVELTRRQETEAMAASVKPLAVLTAMEERLPEAVSTEPEDEEETQLAS